MLNRVFSILSEGWLIHQDTALSYLPALVAFVNGQKMLLEIGTEEKPVIVGMSGDGNIHVEQRPLNFDDQELPDNSLAMLPVSGPLCAWDYRDLDHYLSRAAHNDRIIGVILKIDSPGGMIKGLDVTSNKIKSLGKPVIAVINGMAASAAMWLASACTYRIATSSMDMVGSIGVKTSLRDLSGLMEKVGIKTQDFFATKSTEKDKEARAWLENQDPAPMMEIIDFINDHFHEAIQQNLRIASGSEVFSGGIYFAEKGKELGLINEINTMEYAIEKAYQSGLSNKIKSQSSKIFKLS